MTYIPGLVIDNKANISGHLFLEKLNVLNIFTVHAFYYEYIYLQIDLYLM